MWQESTGRDISPLIHTMRHFLRQAQFFFGEADFFSAKRLFFRAARDVSGEHSEPPWAREGKTENPFSGFIPLVVPRKGFSPHIPVSRLFVLFHPTQPHLSKPHQIKQPLSKITLNERAVCGGQIFWVLRGGGMDKNDYLCVRKSATIV